ncbi:hypothetical protein [Limoniibacter endophyticus]|uniref:Chromosome segregation ATPase n=1 Tax=Limoniibacter endophyticus TaxID=1565040 RepID=A0A8J3GF87_9HYPH|nr:hypothetical protein [Limoniibacter endophyticus]GHC65337.1 hypothetical protein GCM10010136_07980 [Limoniibacter endophyticus]
MIYFALYFGLGFLLAVLLVTFVMPAYRRRIEAKAFRRFRDTMPVSFEEVQAERDRLRAEHAMAVRKLEITSSKASEKSRLLALELERDRSERTRIERVLDQSRSLIADLEGAEASAATALADARARIDATANEAERLKREIAERTEQLSRFERLYEEASLACADLKISLASRESEIDRLNAQASMMKKQSREISKTHNETVNEIQGLELAKASAELRVKQLEEKLQGMMSKLADTEERLERRDRDYALLKGENTASADVDARIAALEADRAHLEAQLLALRQAGDAASSSAGDGKLREELSKMAAQMVQLTALLEGEATPLAAILEKADADQPGAPPSIAARVAALRQKAKA